MNLAEVVADSAEKLSKYGICEANLEAEVLIRMVMDIDKATFFRDLRGDVSVSEQKKINGVIKRRQQREPLAYITGRKEFFGLDFVINEHVLVPRPETELIVETVINYSSKSQNPKLRIVDVGTGSGAIGVCLAHNLPLCDVLCVDLSPEALLVAQTNAEIHDVTEKVDFLEGDLLTAISAKKDIIISNPPYIPSGRISQLQEEVRQEPLVAIDGGPDGFGVIERLLKQSVEKLNTPGLILIEIDTSQVNTGLLHASNNFPDSSISILEDCFGKDRFLQIELF